MKYRAAVFDMDGTILDTLGDLADSTNHALEVCGMPRRSVDEVRRFVGNGLMKLCERAVPEGTDAAGVQRVYDALIPWYGAHCAVKTRPYDGIPEVLKALRAAGVRTAVVSNKADFAVKELAGRYFPGLFDCAVGDSPDRRRKPCPDSVFAVLDSLNLTPADAVYIGDSEVDIETARNAGTDLIAVGWGFRGEGLLLEKGAGSVLRDPHELIKKIIGK